jgi:hypothetical protein
MKTHFKNHAIPPVTAEQLQSVGVDPSDMWFSPTFQTWVFSGLTIQRFPYQTTGAILAELRLTPNPEA